MLYATVISLIVAGVASYFIYPEKRLVHICAVLLTSIVMMYYSVTNILNISYKKKLFDQPDPRRIHKIPTPRLGGIVFPPIICFSTVFTLSLFNPSAPSDLAMSVSGALILICPLSFVYLVGITDDLVGVRPHIKFAAQIMTAMLVVYAGLWIDDLHGLFGIHALHAAVGMPLTVLFIATVINALNLIDGLDGLAAGLCMIAAAFYGVWFYIDEKFLFSSMSFATLGCLVPFIYTNVHGLGPRRRKLFMGDTGSQTIGLVLSMMAVMLLRGDWYADGSTVFVPALSPLLIPVFDMIHVVVFRLKKGSRPFMPDKTHLHHRLLGRGFNQRQTLVLVLCLAAGYVAGNMLLARVAGAGVILAVDAAVWLAFNSRLVSARNPSRRVKGARGNADNAAQVETP